MAPRVPKLPKAAWIVLAVAAGLGLCATVWRTWVQDRVIPRNWGQVEDGLYRSALLSPTLVKRVLKEHRIEVIVAMVWPEPTDVRQAAMERAAADLGIELLRFPMKGDGTARDDRPEALADAVVALAKARKAGKTVLVQCAAGANRTGGVIAAYQLLVRRARPSEVYTQMEQYGWDPRANAQLPEFLNRNMKDLAVRLYREGILDRVPDPVPVISQ